MSRLREIREQKGLTKVELSRRSGVALSYIHSIENDEKSPTVRTLNKLALALGVHPGELLDVVLPDDTGAKTGTVTNEEAKTGTD